MSENSYRTIKAVAIVVFVVGFLILGMIWTQNGRYVQLNVPAQLSTIDHGNLEIKPVIILDTRSGKLIDKGIQRVKVFAANVVELTPERGQR